ncbi:hypothetical protein [Rhodanobacter sp. C01]|uniref:hypothetical protein n=1 Tax=Rhodanobacter sp. C01 TaxID=1945856 RepID=UPI0009865C45|nr:hypothetical protein [Rhodanobacter sp. C01]
MLIKSVAEKLHEHGLAPPDLEFLRPNEHRYTALLMQPCSPILANGQRIGPADVAAAAAKGRRFLELACEEHGHLAITPEYYFPWSALKEAITDGVTPPLDALWVIGSESTTQDELERFKQEIAEHCLVLHEPWENLAQDRTLLDPVTLLFHTKKQDQTLQLVALIQFKTYPSRDDFFFEESLLRKGTQIYKFAGTSGHLFAATIICSDALDIEPVLGQLNYQSTLIHIQLNPSPTHRLYRQYRTKTFQTDADATNCHIVCLNWAHLVEEVDAEGGKPKPWNNISASTWYCPKNKCSSADQIVRPNHNLGLYYTYMEERRHALRFHNEEAVFKLLVPKLICVAAAQMANHNGPIMVGRYTWNTGTKSWMSEENPPKDGFNEYLVNHQNAKIALAGVLGANDPLAVERVLALSAGKISASETWHSLENIDSCILEQDEVVRRISVVQDDQGDNFRHLRISVISEIHYLLKNHPEWPKQVAGVDANSTVQWSMQDRNFNVRTVDEKPTLIVYLDDTHTPKQITNRADKLYELLRKAGSRHQKRLCIVRREHGQIQFVQIEALTRIDEANLEMTDIAAIHPLDDPEPDHG